MEYVPVQRFIRALFASRLPPGVAYLFAGPLLVVEQLKRQLTIIHEANAPAAYRWTRTAISGCAYACAHYPLTHNALNDLAIRGRRWICGHFVYIVGAPRFGRRKTAPQRLARYGMLLAMAAEAGAWLWLR